MSKKSLQIRASALGNLWKTTFGKNTTIRLGLLENNIHSIVQSIGLYEPEEGIEELSLVDRIEALEEKVKLLENK